LRSFRAGYGNDSGKRKTITVLRRLIAYSEKIFSFPKDIVTQVPTAGKAAISHTGGGEIVAGAVLGRLGTSNAWEQSGAPFGSGLAREADLQCRTLRRSPCGAPMPTVAARDSRRLRAPETNKALPDIYGLGVRRFSTSMKARQLNLRIVPGCLQRTSTTAGAIASSFNIGRLR